MPESWRVEGSVERFEGPNGWAYVALDEALSRELRPLVVSTWPALLKVALRLGTTEWTGSVMPIRDGPLFVVIPARVRAKLDISVGDPVVVSMTLPEGPVP